MRPRLSFFIYLNYRLIKSILYDISLSVCIIAFFMFPLSQFIQPLRYFRVHIIILVVYYHMVIAIINYHFISVMVLKNQFSSCIYMTIYTTLCSQYQTINNATNLVGIRNNNSVAFT